MAEPSTDPELVLPINFPQRLSRPLAVRSFGRSDPGRVRPTNQDNFLIAELTRTLLVHHTSLSRDKTQYSNHRGHIFLVADGMGGHQAGEVASALSLTTIEGFLLNSLKPYSLIKAAEDQTVLKQFQHALAQADARIFEEAAAHPEMVGMGTTLTLAFFYHSRLFVAHVGDSRCYLFFGGQLQQVTNDHTMVADMVRRGTLSREAASTSRFRNVVTNALGGNERGVSVDVHQLDVVPGDMVLLCSDGLTSMISNELIATILAEEQEPEKACERLIAEANQQGGRDNITVVVARFAVD